MNNKILYFVILYLVVHFFGSMRKNDGCVCKDENTAFLSQSVPTEEGSIEIFGKIRTYVVMPKFKKSVAFSFYSDKPEKYHMTLKNGEKILLRPKTIYVLSPDLCAIEKEISYSDVNLIRTSYWLAHGADNRSIEPSDRAM